MKSKKKRFAFAKLPIGNKCVNYIIVGTQSDFRLVFDEKKTHSIALAFEQRPRRRRQQQQQ